MDIESVVIEYIAHESGRTPRMRVRMSNWAPDAFKVVSNEDFRLFKTMCEQLGIPMKEIED